MGMCSEVLPLSYMLNISQVSLFLLTSGLQM